MNEAQAINGIELETAALRTTPAELSPEDLAKWEERKKKMEAERAEQERIGKASHSIAQAAHILSLFHKEDVFKYGAGTDFAMELSRMAIKTIHENGKIFDE